MDKLLIRGGRELRGEVLISGAKNAALPELCAALLTDQPVVLHNVPRLQDVSTMLKLVRNMGVSAERDDSGTVRLHAGDLNKPEAPYELVERMRASIVVLGPLLSRFGRAKVSLPGGDNFGTRPIDMHLRGLELMGAEFDVVHGNIEARADRLLGARIVLEFPSHTATDNLVMAAVLAKGSTVIENAAREPEVADLAAMLNRMGARVSGAGTSTIEVEGVDSLHAVEHTVIPDRIEAATWVAAVGIAGGPQAGGIAVVTVHDDLGQGLDTFGHRSRKAMYRRPFRTQRGKLVGVVLGDLMSAEAAHPVRDLLRPREGRFERHLLIKNHPDEQGQRILVQQRVGLRILSEPKLIWD